jgi:hypothetical protein
MLCWQGPTDYGQVIYCEQYKLIKGQRIYSIVLLNKKRTKQILFLVVISVLNSTVCFIDIL